MSIKIFVMDVDGTLTNGKIYMGNDGEIFKAFNVKDGYGIHDILVPTGILPIIITGRTSRIVKKRCEELGIDELYQGIYDKKSCLEEVLQKYRCSFEQVAYIGDDINDIPCMRIIKENHGSIGCPADAVESVKKMQIL